MTVLRSLVFCRLVVGLALAGLLVPLVPTAEASDAQEARLAEVLGHADAVQQALDESRYAPDPLEAFVTAYARFTGQDADDVRAKLGGDALWHSTEIPAPHAVLATTSLSATASGASLVATLGETGPLFLAAREAAPPAPVLPDLPRGERPRAHGARGP